MNISLTMRIPYSAPMLPEREKIPRKLECSIIYASNLVRTAWPNDAGFIIPIIYCCRLIRSFRLFQQFWISGLSGFPVVPDVLSFWLSGRSGFPVDSDVLSFWLFSGRSGH